MPSSRWDFMFAYAQFKLTYHNILRSLYTPAKRLDALICEIHEADRQREFDTYRKDERIAAAYRQTDRQQIRKHKLVGFDSQGIYYGVIKVDGVWRDLQYHMSFRREHTVPRRTFAGDYRPSFRAPGTNKITPRIRAIRDIVQAQDADMYYGIKSLPMDRPFTGWTEE